MAGFERPVTQDSTHARPRASPGAGRRASTDRASYDIVAGEIESWQAVFEAKQITVPA